MNIVNISEKFGLDNTDVQNVVRLLEWGYKICTIAPSYDVTDKQLKQILHDRAGYTIESLDGK